MLSGKDERAGRGTKLLDRLGAVGHSSRLSSSSAGGAADGRDHRDTSVGPGVGVGCLAQRHLGAGPERVDLQLECLASISSRLHDEGKETQARGLELLMDPEGSPCSQNVLRCRDALVFSLLFFSFFLVQRDISCSLAVHNPVMSTGIFQTQRRWCPVSPIGQASPILHVERRTATLV